MKRITTTTPVRGLVVGDYTLTEYDHTSSKITRWTPRGYCVLNEEHSLGTIEGLEIYIGIDWLYNTCPNPADPDHAKFFEGYTKEEMSRYKPYWDGSISAEYYRYKKNLHEKQRWGFAGISLIAFANGIQIGDRESIAKYTEVGYAPSLNADDFGTPTYLNDTNTIAYWVENNQEVIKKFAEDRRLEAYEFINATLKKLGE
jgi:hypothetical protein